MGQKKKIFDRAYRDYYDIILTYICKKTDNFDTAKDIVQEVFTSFYNNCETVQNVKAWLFAVSKNEIIKQYRIDVKEEKKTRSLELEIDDEKNIVKPDDKNMSYDEVISSISEKYAKNKREKEAFILFAEGFSIKEIAKKMGISIKQARYATDQMRERIDALNQNKKINSLKDLLDE